MPRIALVSLESPDYSPDIVADGLIRLLGRDNVHLVYGTTEMSQDARYTHLMAGFSDRPNAFPIHDADALIVSDRSGGGHAHEWIARTGKRNVAILDGEDTQGVREDLRSLAKVYFKREYLKDRSYPGNVKPLPFAAIPEEPTDRMPIERAVFFMGHYADHPVRTQIAERMAAMGLPILLATWPKNEYNRALRGSLIGVSMRGWGWDTYRYWEIPYFGCCLLSERVGIVIPSDFIEDEEAVFYSGPDEFQSKLSALLNDPDRARRIAEQGKKACLARHLSIHRAKTVLEALL